jgi:hypothetical protein
MQPKRTSIAVALAAGLGLAVTGALAANDAAPARPAQPSQRILILVPVPAQASPGQPSDDTTIQDGSSGGMIILVPKDQGRDAQAPGDEDNSASPSESSPGDNGAVPDQATPGTPDDASPPDRSAPGASSPTPGPGNRPAPGQNDGQDNGAAPGGAPAPDLGPSMPAPNQGLPPNTTAGNDQPEGQPGDSIVILVPHRRVQDPGLDGINMI